MASDRYADLEQAREQRGDIGVVEKLIAELRRKRQPRELFEALKMKARQDAGLAPLAQRNDAPLPPAVRDKLEHGMFAACREVGMLLLDEGRIREGWMYLQPVGDVPAVARRLARIEPNDQNMDELIEVSLYEGVDVPRGYQLMLEHYGVCNSITAFESALGQRSADDQQAAAELLVRRLHSDLLENVKADIERREGKPPQGERLIEVIKDRPWLFGEGAYHIDTTHLASTVRFARALAKEEPLRLALDLTEYGRRLHPQFQYPGDAPFEEQYVGHAYYFRALLGEDIAAAVRYFEQRVRALDARQHGRAPLEIFADFLARLGRPDEAIAILDELGTDDAGPPLGICPSMLELHQQAGKLEQWLQRCRQEDDLLGFASGLIA